MAGPRSAARQSYSIIGDSFFKVPVQRVTKYLLLLSRLHKVTPTHHTDKNDIKLAQDKIEAALEQMNKVRK